MTNLVTNAFRYGVPPVTVRAEQSDRHFRLWVEDAGAVSPPSSSPTCSSGSRGARARVRARSAPGLRLAIARSYARAHGGDLLYEDADPHGARFLLVFPAQPRPSSA